MLKLNVCGERHRAFAETVHLVIRTVTGYAGRGRGYGRGPPRRQFAGVRQGQ